MDTKQRVAERPAQGDRITNQPLSEATQAQPNSEHKQPAEELDEYHKLELEQLVTRINSLETVIVQIGAFFGTANFTILGIAFTVQKAGIIFIAASILIAFLVIDASVRRMLLIYYYRGLRLQMRYAPDDNETFLRILPTGLAARARRIAELEDSQERQTALSSMWSALGWLFFLSQMIVLLEIVAGFVLWRLFNWPLF